MKDEIFGPLLPIMEYTNIESAIQFINSRPKPLALYIFCGNQTVIDSVVNKTSSGGVSVNDVIMHFCNSFLPFGGVETSGIGSYHHKDGFDNFSHRKGVLHKSTWLDAPQRYPPYTSMNYEVFKYLASIYRINSDSFKRIFVRLFLPIVLVFAGKKFLYRSML